MPKAFLSHSSKDKKNFVDLVAKQLGENNCIYDSLTFEGGLKTIEEIVKGLESTDLFVIFLSESALESKWVKDELNRAYDLYKIGQLKRIYPIIIDFRIDYNDLRIPEWMREEYDLKPVTRPAVAVRRIKERLKDIAWINHPRLKERERIFVGRNDLIKKFEERIDDIDKVMPLCIIASGLPDTGRRSLVKFCLRKTSIINEYYQNPVLHLVAQDSIENFIMYLNDSGLPGSINIENLMITTLEAKYNLAVKQLQDIAKAKQIFFIIDNGCIINSYGQISSWFINIIDKLEPINKVVLAVISRYNPQRSNFKKDNIFHLQIPFLNRQERIGLFKRYLDFQKVELKNDDLNLFVGLMQGYPEQVFFTVDFIKDNLIEAKKNPHLFVEYAAEKVRTVMNRYADDDFALGFLRFLSEFEFASLDLIEQLTMNRERSEKLLETFFINNICERFGVANEYFKLNDAVRDYISRTRISLGDDYKKTINNHINDFLLSKDYFSVDVSDFMFSLKTALLNKIDVPDNIRIPSLYVKTISELYYVSRSYRSIIVLAEKALENEEFMDIAIANEIRYFYCAALIRLGDDRFLSQVMKIHSAEHNFLMGFYYRMNGKYEDAIERLNKYLKDKPKSQKGKRELVQVYLEVDDYDEAINLVRNNINYEGNNEYHIEVYLRCLLKKYSTENKDIVLKLLENLRRIPNDHAREMYLTRYATFYAYYERNENKAFEKINEAITTFPTHIHPLLTKAEICQHYDDINGLEDVLRRIKEYDDTYGGLEVQAHKNTRKKYEAHLFAMKGDKSQALKIINTLIPFYPKKSIDRLKRRIKAYR